MLGRELGKLSLELLAILAAAGAIVILGRRRGHAGSSRAAVVPVVGVLAVVLTIVQLFTAGSKLHRLAVRPVSARTGVEHCFGEQGAEARLPFIRWVRARIGSGRYALDYAGEPDLLCVYLVLLPGLPAQEPRQASWTIAFGSVPKEMENRIAHSDPTVQVFAPGFALERNRR